MAIERQSKTKLLPAPYGGRANQTQALLERTIAVGSVNVQKAFRKAGRA